MSVPSHGDIGIRCSRDPGNLWFHLGSKGILTLPGTSTHELGDSLSFSRGRVWDDLSPMGRAICGRLLSNVEPHEIAVRPTYFDLVLRRDRGSEIIPVWRTALPYVVRVIREALNEPKATVYRIPPHAAIEEWHVPLLEELFG